MKFRRPPTLKTADDFISAAGTPIQLGQGADTAVALMTQPVVVNRIPTAVPKAPLEGQERAQGHPWEGKRADKQTEVFNLRLTEVELEKLRYIAAHTPDSMQAFIRKTLLPAIDAKLQDLV